jgi:hypothetical protein
MHLSDIYERYYKVVKIEHDSHKNLIFFYLDVRYLTSLEILASTVYKRKRSQEKRGAFRVAYSVSACVV